LDEKRKESKVSRRFLVIFGKLRNAHVKECGKSKVLQKDNLLR